MKVIGSEPEQRVYNHGTGIGYDGIYRHQKDFIDNRRCDILLRSSTCSGKTAAFLAAAGKLAEESKTGRYTALYLVPTRLLANSQFDSLKQWAENNRLDSTILRPGLSASQLTFETGNHLVVSSPDIIFYMLLRRSRGWKTAFELTLDHVSVICFDELHLYDTYTLFNIRNLIHAVKTETDVPIWFLTATDEISSTGAAGDMIQLTGSGKTFDVTTRAVDLDTRNIDILEKWLNGLGSLDNTVLLLNSVQRAKRLRRRFPDAAWLVGRINYDPALGDPEEQIRKELEKCRAGVFTITTSVFRQGVDLDFQHLITEEPLTASDAVQTFGRCGRRDNQCQFTVITGKSSVKRYLNQDIEKTRQLFESEFSAFYRQTIRRELTELAKGCWYKLYIQTKLKEFLKPSVDEEMKAAYEKYREYLPSVSFRQPLPALKTGLDQVGLFNLLRYRGIASFIKPVQDTSSENSNTVGVFTGRSKLAEGAFRFAKISERPPFICHAMEEIPGLGLYHLNLQFNDVRFSINAKVGKRDVFQWRFLKKSWRSSRGKEFSFEPDMLGDASNDKGY